MKGHTMAYKLTPGGQIPEHFQNVGLGWRPLLEELHKELLEIRPDYQVVQVKEKWGTLRVYIGGTPIQADIIGGGRVINAKIKDTATDTDWRTVQTIVNKYEKKSAEICEEDGQPGRLRNDQYWVRTLCDDCANLRGINNPESSN